MGPGGATHACSLVARGSVSTLLRFPRNAQQTFRVAAITLAACSLTGCVKHLPPAPVPESVVPRVAAAPPPANTARLLVDVVEGPAPALRVYMRPEPSHSGSHVTYRFSEVPETLCPTTPCVADVPSGNLLLGFPVLGDPGNLEVELVRVGPEPSVYRRSLSIYDGHTGTERVLGIIATAIGGSSAITGTALLPIGLARDNRGLTLAGGITLGAGAALLTLGILAIRHDAPTYRPGSSNHFPLPPTAP